MNLTALGERTLVQLRGGYIGGSGWDTAERQGAKYVTNRYSLENEERGGNPLLLSVPTHELN